MFHPILTIYRYLISVRWHRAQKAMKVLTANGKALLPLAALQANRRIVHQNRFQDLMERIPIQIITTKAGSAELSHSNYKPLAMLASAERK